MNELVQQSPITQKKPPWTTLFVLQAEEQNQITQPPHYDTDSFSIRIDNHSSYCVTNARHDFISKLTPIRANVKGINGAVKVRYKGTVKWKWEDDLGQSTTHIIHDTLFMPTYLNAIF